jgi:hypothetical protein
MLASDSSFTYPKSHFGSVIKFTSIASGTARLSASSSSLNDPTLSRSTGTDRLAWRSHQFDVAETSREGDAVPHEID